MQLVRQPAETGLALPLVQGGVGGMMDLQQHVQIHAAEQAQATWPPPKPTCGYPDCTSDANFVCQYQDGKDVRAAWSCAAHVVFLQNQVNVLTVEEFKR